MTTIFNEDIKKKAYSIASSHYIKLKYTNHYLYKITNKQLKEIATLFNVSTEFVDSLILSTSNFRVVN